jgi:hypothetical protein
MGPKLLGLAKDGHEESGPMAAPVEPQDSPADDKVTDLGPDNSSLPHKIFIAHITTHFEWVFTNTPLRGQSRKRIA